ncbi:mevalonate kinase family protein [Marinifilum caeruleilacunae]|uniref:Mevalonate kinase n=1 Tax=Marinifilum caeruleilacunae TaxID=2499076 RepID=A0ABX1WYM0_9BACT|nr:mevalonate kinase [Marinifilum caeruleilacunae]NOU61086.1 mevalonate kinase [Marinifilum caeruleilacunae]
MVNKADNWVYGKLLLFGEYSVLMDSMALSIPCHQFKARLRFEPYKESEISRNSNDQLQIYLKYLLSHSDSFQSILDLSNLERDIRSGMYFDSSIPISYGVGSSGALCAALYQRYGNSQQVDNHDLSSLKEILAMMEGGFHGKSSGLDPLISYLNQAVILSSKNQINIVDIQVDEMAGENALILIDTQQKGDTAPLVTSFLNRCNNEKYNKLIRNELIPITNKCISSFCNHDSDLFFQSIQALSGFQYNHFADKIPIGFKELWKTGIDSQQFHLKLCGSGGGGFLLCFTRNASETELFLSKMGYSHQRLALNF